MYEQRGDDSLIIGLVFFFKTAVFFLVCEIVDYCEEKSDWMSIFYHVCYR